MIVKMLNLFLFVSVLFLCVDANTAETSTIILEEIVAHVRFLEQEVGRVKTKLETVQSELETQQRINKNQNEEILSQRTVIDWLRTVNGELEAKVKTVGLQSKDETAADKLEPKVKKNKSDVSMKENGRVVRQEREQVAFSAYLNRDLSNLGPGHIIQYGATHINEGNAFNALTGIFTVPVDGVYLLSFACEDYHGHRIFADIIVDGSRVSLVVESSNHGHGMGTNVVIVRLKQGQSVWVAIDAAGQGEYLQNGASTFSGVFLYN